MPTVNLPKVSIIRIGPFMFEAHIKKCSHIPVKLNLRKQMIDELTSQYHSSLKETLFIIFMLSYNSTVCMHTMHLFIFKKFLFTVLFTFE
jgi:hypothetical protein